jgi:aryl carrier-like protein
VAAPGESKPSVAELKELVGATLPRHFEPSSFVVLGTFPFTANGKLDRSALPAPAAATPTITRAPSTELEHELAALWEEVLGIRGIGVEDNFFELGGDSMHAVTLIGRARLRGLTITVEELFRTPTVAALAKRQVRGEPPEPAQPAPGADEHGFGQFSLLSPEDLARLEQADA